MSRLNPVNKKARKIEQTIIAAQGDVEALQKKTNANPGRVYYPMGCTLNFTPGWEVDNSGGTAGLCQPVERDLFDCYLRLRLAGAGSGSPQQCPRLDRQVRFSRQRLAQSRQSFSRRLFFHRSYSCR